MAFSGEMSYSGSSNLGTVIPKFTEDAETSGVGRRHKRDFALRVSLRFPKRGFSNN